MKGFVTNCSIIIILVLVVEIFCPARVMKKSLYMVFSLIILVVVLGGVKDIFTKEESNFIENININLELSKDNLFGDCVYNIESQVQKSLVGAGIKVKNVSIDYSINELSLVFTSAVIEVELEKDKQKALEIVQSITGLDEQEVEIWVNS